MNKLDDVLQHYGIKGMRWGVSREVGANGRVRSATKTSIKEKWNSSKRERSWNQTIRNMNDLSTSEISVVTRRITLENDFKRLSKDRDIADKKDRADYVRRGEMDNSTLSQTVTRLRAKENLRKAVGLATKEQKEFGEKVATVAGALALSYASKKAVSPKDLVGTMSDSKDVRKKSLTNIAKKSLTNDKTSK